MSFILTAEAASMVPAVLIALYDNDTDVVKAFLITIALTALMIAFLAASCRNARNELYAREGMICAAGAWVVMSFIGCLPFFFSGEIPNFVDALFEIVSGFTTTGATILEDVEAMSRGLIYWRSFSHWLGGMGVLVFVLSLVNIKGSNNGITLHLLRAESPGPEVDKIVPHMRKNSLILYGIYCVLTIINIIFLLAGGMPLFDTICTAFGTAGTGGFGIWNDSMASYSPYLQTVTGVFMLLFGINFSLYYLLLLGRLKSVFKNAELNLYLAIITISTIVISINISPMYKSVGESIRQAFFQVSSIITTTGYSTTNFDLWPGLSKSIILVLMLVGACAGSTGGGLKCSRVVILFKAVKRNIEQTLHPRKISVVRVNNTPVMEKTVESTLVYLAIYMFIGFISFLLISVDGYSVETNFSAMLSCFNNIGPGLGYVGLTSNFDNYSMFSKIVLIFDMLAGRLEILPMVCLFSPTAWKHR